jgi:hypothetical protein
MNLNPIMDYLRYTVLNEINLALKELRSNGGADDEVESGRRHKANVVDMLEMKHGPDTIANYLEWRANRLERHAAPLGPEERTYVDAHAPYCRRAAKALYSAAVFTMDEDPLAA